MIPTTQSKPLWIPSARLVDQANMGRFLKQVREQEETAVCDYASLYQWSIDKPEKFWPALWEFCDIQSSRHWETVVSHPEKMPGAQWFAGAQLNFAENLLRYRDDSAALIFVGESGTRVEISHAELFEHVARLAAALRNAGVVVGDRLCGYLPNTPETVIAMLATTSLGAIWSSCSPDFGTRAVVDRFSQIGPKIIFTVAGYYYNGVWIDLQQQSVDIRNQLPSIQQLVVVPYPGEKTATTIPDSISYAKFINGYDGARPGFTQYPFDHPLYILSSSGTTGPPKCIVHGAGGTLIQHLKELVLHTDLKPGNRIFYFTTCGWMMWNWLISSLATGATVILYDGAPMYPNPDALFDLAAREGISIFGTSAKYLAAVEKAGIRPKDTHDLSALKAILSTGSPLSVQSFDYVYRDIKPDVQLSSISGGTDIISCFALGNPVLPVYRGELQCRGLGMQVEVFNEQGQSVQGEKGELVCTAPFPSMPISFWKDPDGQRYQEAYFERFPGVWAHGDYAELTTHDGLIIYGRSDAVLNPAGVRIGTAEIYRMVEALPEVLECLAIGQEWNNDVRIILFVKLDDELELDDDLIDKIKTTLHDNASPRHVPAKVIAVPDIPRTVSGKIVELAVREVIHNRPVLNKDALANPEALEYFNKLPELQ